MWLSQIRIAAALSFTVYGNAGLVKFVKKKVGEQKPFSEVTG